MHFQLAAPPTPPLLFRIPTELHQSNRSIVHNSTLAMLSKAPAMNVAHSTCVGRPILVYGSEEIQRGYVPL